MLEVAGIDNVVLHLPMCCQLSQWIINSLQQLSLDTTIQNSWTLGEYSFSPASAILEEEEEEAQAVANATIEAEDDASAILEEEEEEGTVANGSTFEAEDNASSSILEGEEEEEAASSKHYH